MKIREFRSAPRRRVNLILLSLFILLFSPPATAIRRDVSLRPKLNCKTTVQGRYYLTDDNGFVCDSFSADPRSHCCPERGDRFSCQGCNIVSQCCNSYEFCVSCCLNPEMTHKELALKVKIAKPVTAGFYGSTFNYCAGRCRHNSESVVHENAYLSEFHHCFSIPSNTSESLSTQLESRLAGINVIIGRRGESCDSVCKSNGHSCVPNKLAVLNQCEVTLVHAYIREGNLLFLVMDRTVIRGGYALAHEKSAAKPLGEDAHFVCRNAQVIGVADGVSFWARRGIDAGKYARQLMRNAADSVKKSLPASVNPKSVLIDAFVKTTAPGSSTACIVSLDGKRLRAANVGDSGFVVIRKGKTVFRSPVQQHKFNVPYQLGLKSADSPDVAEEMAVELESGDVVVVATDGLFDNVFPEVVEATVERCLKNRMPPGVAARVLAEKARRKSLARDIVSPFDVEARKAGFRRRGGKYDDITVVVAYARA